MWSIDVYTTQLKTFFDPLPLYAILYHTWGPDEISFRDIQGPPDLYTHKASYAKVQGAMAQAKADGLNYIWIDTCCIDKSSSAELQEAINSMFQWYKQAARCYAYLSDVRNVCDLTSDKSFAACRWFMRGWTLQELIAPREVIFYSMTRLGPTLRLVTLLLKNWRGSRA